MKMCASDEVGRGWCIRHKSEIHKAANKYMLKSSQVIITCSG